MNNFLSITNIIRGRKLNYHDFEKPPSISEKIYSMEIYTNKKMTNREFLAEAKENCFDLASTQFTSFKG
tara:strand:- start:13886 stop:14092 length:207 start_codon:yes stop_codon:yes gene_type:complete